MVTTPDVPVDLGTKLRLDAAVYGHGIAYLQDGEWVRLDPHKLVVVTHQPERGEDSKGYPLLEAVK